MDYTNALPEECLALILSLLTTRNDRNNSSLVSHRWLRVEAQTRTHLTLYARLSLKPFIPSIFTRFNSLTRLVLSCNYHTISDDDIMLITSMCPNLTNLKLHGDQLTDLGMAIFFKNCKKLKEFSCSCCAFTYKGMSELLDNSSHLEVFSVEESYFPYFPDNKPLPNFHIPNSLKVIKLKRCCHNVLLEALIVGLKILKRLELIDCRGSWDRSLEMIRDDNCLVEVHLENVNVTDIFSLSKCRNLTALLIYNVKCTNVGLISVAENCKGLKKLYVGHWNTWYPHRIRDDGLIAVGKHSVNLEELILNGVGPSCDSLEVIATNCQKLKRLELYGCKWITKAELLCIAKRCVALRKFLFR